MAKQLSAQDARGGKTLGVMRYVLGISSVGAVLALLATWLILMPGQ